MRIARLALVLFLAIATLSAAIYAAFLVSPWPAVLLVRRVFDRDSAERIRALEKHVPPGVSELRDQRYGSDDSALLDLFTPADRAPGKPLPAVVWIHGGAFIAGDRRDVAPYLKILAARGFAAAGVGYAIAPGGRYPTPVRQANEAIGFLLRNAGRLGIDPDRIILAGDSAGAQIAAQLAAVVSDESYAAAVGLAPALSRAGLRGVILFCGVYDAPIIRLDGDFGSFIRTAMWSYLGKKNFADDPRIAQMSVNRHVTAAFPPTFISVGNADPLGPQSVLVADALRAKGVETDALFFPPDYAPPLAHEYQFNLDGAAGRQALERLTAFLRRVAN